MGGGGYFLELDNGMIDNLYFVQGGVGTSSALLQIAIAVIVSLWTYYFKQTYGGWGGNKNSLGLDNGND